MIIQLAIIIGVGAGIAIGAGVWAAFYVQGHDEPKGPAAGLKHQQ